MNSYAFVTLSRYARALSRRGSLRALGGVALATALASPANARAGKSGKKKNANKLCKKQKVQCIDAVATYCATLLNPPFCENVYRPCCEQFTGCNVDAGIACFFAAD